LSATTQPVRVKPVARPAKPAKKETSAPSPKPPLEPIPQMDVEEPPGETSPAPADKEGPVSWHPPQKPGPFLKPSPFTKPGARPPQKNPAQSAPSRPSANQGQAQTPALIPIRPRPVEEMSITENETFFEPEAKPSPPQKKSKEKKPKESPKLIPLSKLTSSTEEQDEEEETSPPPRPRSESKPRRASAQKRSSVADTSSAALSEIMSEAMRSLSQQLGLAKSTQKKVITPPASPAEVVEEVEPQTMNDILKDLGRIDPNIEASSIIRQDGTILAAATSHRLNESLLSVIAGTLSNISRDVMQAMEAGKLKFTSIHGTQGILFLAPLFADMLLIVYTNPLSRPGVINVASHRVRAQLMKYMGMKEADVETKSAIEG
jgi:predicted regulator of Ras-like GTPase activity (Roadblock/LC7/MglB family)